MFWVIERVGDVNFTRRIEVCERMTFEGQEGRLDALLGLPNMVRGCIDNTGMGRQFVERAQARHGKYKVEAVTFTSNVKETLAYPVRAALEGRTVRVPGDKYVRSDLRGIRKECTTSGNVRFTGERSVNGHCDRFWALALALHAGKSATRGFAYERVERAGSGGSQQRTEMGMGYSL